MPERRTPLWLWPNLLSLDAPIVAMVWLFMFQKIWLQVLPWGYYAALGLAVWGIYITDRILDVKMLSPSDMRLGTRHDFHRRHLKSMAAVASLAFVGSLVMAGTHMSYGPLLDYGKPVIFLVIGFFSMTVFSKQDQEIPHLRNVFAGLAFAYGTSMGAHWYTGKSGVIDLVHPPFNLMLSPEMLAFAILCMLNISAIHFWEQSRNTNDPDTKAAHELALTLPLILLGAGCIVLALLDEESRSRPFYYSVLIASALLYIANRERDRFSLDALRVMADAAMIAPLPVFIALTAAA